MGTIISILNIKGGVGKSTIAINLAGALSSRSQTVLLVDADPQATVLEWHRARSKNNPSSPVHHTLAIKDHRLSLENFKTVLHTDAQKHDYVIIDCPPEDARITRASLVYSHYCIIPVTPSSYDLRSTHKVVQLLADIKQSKISTIKPYLLISKRIAGTTLGAQIRASLQVFEIPILKTEIYHRIALAESGYFGQTIFEYSPASTATQEFKHLAQEVASW